MCAMCSREPVATAADGHFDAEFPFSAAPGMPRRPSDDVRTPFGSCAMMSGVSNIPATYCSARRISSAVATNVRHR